MSEKTAAEQIDDIITQHGGWKGQTLTQIRAAVHAADPDAVEEIKWRMKTRPEGLAVWSHSGIVCFAEVWKDNVKLIFSKGAHLKDAGKLFNARLESKDLRAVEFREGNEVAPAELQALIGEAVNFNLKKVV